MEACGAWNWYGGNQTKTDACVGVVLSSRMAYSVEAFYGESDAIWVIFLGMKLTR